MKWDPKKKNIRKEGEKSILPWRNCERKLFHDMQDNLLKKTLLLSSIKQPTKDKKTKTKTIAPLLSFNSQLENIFKRKFTHNSHKNCKIYPAWNLTGSIEDPYKEHYYWICKMQLG